MLKPRWPSFASGSRIDLKLWRSIALRLAQIDLVPTDFSNDASSASNNLAPRRPNNARISTGVVIRLGLRESGLVGVTVFVGPLLGDALWAAPRGGPRDGRAIKSKHDRHKSIDLYRLTIESGRAVAPLHHRCRLSCNE